MIYSRFCQAWKDEKRFQKYLVETQGAKIVVDDGRKFVENAEGQRSALLGQRPTFNMWMKMNAAAAEQQTLQDDKQVGVDDLSWSEGG
jgi:hypothetical protein